MEKIKGSNDTTKAAMDMGKNILEATEGKRLL